MFLTTLCLGAKTIKKANVHQDVKGLNCGTLSNGMSLNKKRKCAICTHNNMLNLKTILLNKSRQTPSPQKDI